MTVPNRTRLWVALAAVAAVCAAVVAVVLLRTDSSTSGSGSSDCGVVTELVTQWTSTVGAAQAKVDSGDAGQADTLALADAEQAGATRIRTAVPRVGSPAIAADLTKWADGAEQLARSRRDGVEHPNPDVTAPPPADYLQGSAAVQTATADLLKACPSARTNPAA